MKHFKQLLCVTAVLCAGCGSDYSPPPGVSPPGGANAVDFSTFVSTQYGTPPSETALPVEVEATNFTFADDDNPRAFDSVIATAP